MSTKLYRIKIGTVAPKLCNSMNNLLPQFPHKLCYWSEINFIFVNKIQIKLLWVYIKLHIHVYHKSARHSENKECLVKSVHEVKVRGRRGEWLARGYGGLGYFIDGTFKYISARAAIYSGHNKHYFRRCSSFRSYGSCELEKLFQSFS